MKLFALILLTVASYGVSAQCSTPTGLSTTGITTSSSTANWNPVSGAISYDVDYQASSWGYWINIASGTTSTSWDLLGMPASTTFNWRVKANCSSGSSSYAETTFSTLSSQTGSCGAPTGLSTSPITASSATAHWAAVSGATTYDVEYKPASSSTWTTFGFGTSGLQWTISGLEPTTSYNWRVKATCASGVSSYTQTQFTTGALGSCSAPGGLFTSNIGSNTVTMNWSLVSGAYSYAVEYKPTSSGTWLYATTGTAGTSVNLYSLSAGTTYDWRVTASCSLTEVSGYSFGQFTTSGSTPPPPPTSGCPGPYDVSTNGTIGGAAAISVNTDVKGTIASRDDIDYYQFTISSGGSITVWLTTLPGNYDLAVLNSSGTQIGISKNKGTKNESLSLNVAAGTYYAKVYPAGTANNATSCYTLKVYTGTASRVATTSNNVTPTATSVTGAATQENMNPNFTINVFPNPAGDQLNLSVEGVDKKTVIKVYNLMGKLVMQRESSNTLTQLNISKLSAGFYLVKVNDGKEIRSAKFIKQ